MIFSPPPQDNRVYNHYWPLDERLTLHPRWTRRRMGAQQPKAGAADLRGAIPDLRQSIGR